MGEITATLRRSWQSHFWTNLATITILTLSFSLILGAILFTTNLSRVFSVWGQEIQITVYLKDGLSQEAVSNAETAIKNQPSVESVQYVDKAGAASSFEKSLSSYGPNFLQSLKEENENPFPASFSVHVLTSDKNPEKIEALAQKLGQVAGVEDVSYGQEWLKNYSLLLKISQYIAVIFTIVLLGACVFTVSNAIQASLFTRREEIEILELVGATSQTIRRPYIIEGAFQGLVAVNVSVIVLAVIYKVLLQAFEHVLGASSVVPALGFLSVGVVAVALISGVAIGALGSYICVARLNTGWAAAGESQA